MSETDTDDRQPTEKPATPQGWMGKIGQALAEGFSACAPIDYTAATGWVERCEANPEPTPGQSVPRK